MTPEELDRTKIHAVPKVVVVSVGYWRQLQVGMPCRASPDEGDGGGEFDSGAVTPLVRSRQRNGGAGFR